MSAICHKALCLCFSELKRDYWQELESGAWTEEMSGCDSYCPCLWSDLSEPLSCLSAWCLTSVWCSTGLREDQALPELALPLSPCNRSSANTSNTPPTPFFRCELMNYFYQKICAVCWLTRGEWTTALRESVEQSKKTKSAGQTWFPHHWPLHGDCGMILMAPVSVLVSKPVWLSLAPCSLGSGPVLGQLCSMSKHVRDFLLGFPSREKEG